MIFRFRQPSAEQLARDLVFSINATLRLDLNARIALGIIVTVHNAGTREASSLTE
jgi:hypothetical protein